MNKILITFLGVLFVIPTFAAEVTEPGQTESFVSVLMGIFSTQTLLKVIFAIVAIVLTYMISKLIQGKMFRYLESANIGDEAGKEELIGVISRTINVIVLVTGFSITL